MDRLTDRRTDVTDGRTDGQTDDQTGRQMDGPRDGRSDRRAGRLLGERWRWPMTIDMAADISRPASLRSIPVASRNGRRLAHRHDVTADADDPSVWI